MGLIISVDWLHKQELPKSAPRQETEQVFVWSGNGLLRRWVAILGSGIDKVKLPGPCSENTALAFQGVWLTRSLLSPAMVSSPLCCGYITSSSLSSAPMQWHHLPLPKFLLPSHRSAPTFRKHHRYLSAFYPEKLMSPDSDKHRLWGRKEVIHPNMLFLSGAFSPKHH